MKIKIENKTALHVYDELTEKSDTNIFLEEHAFYLNKNMKKGLPLIFINDEVFYGGWNKEELFRSLCSALDSESKPKSCLSPIKRDDMEDSQSVWEYFYILFFVVMIGITIMLVTYFICKKYFNINYFNHKISKDLEDSSKNKQYLHF